MHGAPRIYLDHNATSVLRPSARDAALAAMDAVGNPSSIHAEGRAARALVEAARESVAALVGAASANVTFTSGGTEAVALALTPHIEIGRERRPLDRLLVGATEHACVLSGGRFAPDRVERIPVDAMGLCDLGWLRERLSLLASRGERALVALQAANNETGVLQPVRAAADVVHEFGGVLLCDAVQAAGRVPFVMTDSGADLVALSAHKLGGLQGAGALVRASDAVRIAAPLTTGGGQERGLRAGTEAVPAIAAFGAAAREASVGADDEAIRLAGLRDRWEAGLRAMSPDAVVFAAQAPRLPNTSLVALPGCPAETALIRLDLAGVAASSGSACSSGKVKRSHVLDAMQVDPAAAQAAIRLSFGWTSREDDVIQTLGVFEKLVDALSERAKRQAA